MNTELWLFVKSWGGPKNGSSEEQRQAAPFCIG